MLDIMRRKKRLKIILWLVIISLGLGMVLFFVPGGNLGDTSLDTSAATVDGDTVSFQLLAQSYHRAVSSLNADPQNRLDPAILKSLGIGQRILDGLINVRVTRIAAERLGIDVSPEELRHAIETHPNLQNQGKFIGLEQYKAILASNSISLDEFEESLRDLLLEKKLRSVLTASVDVTAGELRDEFVRSNQEAKVRYILFKSSDFTRQVNPTESDLRAYLRCAQNEVSGTGTPPRPISTDPAGRRHGNRGRKRRRNPAGMGQIASRGYGGSCPYSLFAFRSCKGVRSQNQG